MPDQKEFITHFEVSNFKKFDHLVVENIGQFNLITGDNNVGKTCLLEALMIDEHPKKTMSYLSESLIKRELKNYKLDRFLIDKDDSEELLDKLNDIAFYLKVKNQPILISKNKLKIKIDLLNTQIRKEESNSKIKEFITEVNLFDYKKNNLNSKNWIVFYNNNEVRYLADISSEYYYENKQKFYSPSVMLPDNIISFLTDVNKQVLDNPVIKSSILKILNNIFNLGISDIQFFPEDYSNNNFISELKLTIGENSFNIFRYGEGFTRIFHIIFLSFCDTDTIYIDEIETGIHFDRLVPFFKELINVIKERGIQLFATTHSQECIEAYAKALEELGMEEKGRIIMLQEENKSVKSYTFKSLDEHLDYRG